MDYTELNKYYKFPIIDRGLRVTDSNYNHMFDWIARVSDISKEKFITALNGSVVYSRKVVKFVANHESRSIESDDGFKLLQVRGWGHLTGLGGLGLSYEEATEVQNAVLDYCVNQLNNNIKYNRIL